MKLIEEYLTRDDAEMAQDCDAVLIRGNCLCDAENLKKFKSYGINWVFTRTVGYNHFDLQAAKKLGISIARVPNYSPFAVANLAFTLGENLVHHVAEASYEVHLGDFIMHPQYFATEFNRLTIGIFGAGKIGVAEAKLWDGIGYLHMIHFHLIMLSSTLILSLRMNCSKRAMLSLFMCHIFLKR
ncbi:D-isomer specific 2-hydroxyacid dehydrogenase, catalytic domain protein [Lactobacillus amylolyticus DSM 11664]|uniref:D-isomer specific 2-hydroxyacid dehydrogenase, catalytic domain protein n=1 Tax=Lactobacillus amylolyticus DSM 11664 TaxID=585524 RepID=D4YRR4_9LACO|nr:D-isomer specific 2-hydroxyacid dehydrogenase, catalytic domain protein [Lactobacillus amylolyticus DSM 11664]